MLRLINDLLKQPQLARAPFTNLTPLLEGGLYSLKKRSLVFVISDFICAPGWERTLNLLNQRHEVLAVRLWDPREIELPDIGMVVMEDAETGDQMFVDTHDRRFRRRFEEAAQQREAELAQAFKRAGSGSLTALNRRRFGTGYRPFRNSAPATKKVIRVSLCHSFGLQCFFL